MTGRMHAIYIALKPGSGTIDAIFNEVFDATFN